MLPLRWRVHLQTSTDGPGEGPVPLRPDYSLQPTF